MNWFLIALIGPVLYAATNHIDKYLLEKYFKGREAGALVLFSALFSIVALPIIYTIEPAVFSIGLKTIIALSLNGAITVICIILYFKALKEDEASTVIPFTQMIPIFGFVLGYFVLGEILNLKQILACLLVLIGIIILSFDLNGSKITVKTKVVSLMLVWSLLFAISDVVFKFIAIDVGFWHSLFWEFAGRVFLGVLLLIIINSYRNDFIRVIKINTFQVIFLNSFNEIIFIIADGVANFALLLAPVVLVMTVNSTQPVFVLIFGIVLSFLFPKIFKESLTKKNILQKTTAIGLIVAGTCVLALTGAI